MSKLKTILDSMLAKNNDANDEHIINAVVIEIHKTGGLGIQFSLGDDEAQAKAALLQLFKDCIERISTGAHDLEETKTH